MMKLLPRIRSLVILLIAIQVTKNDAAKITSNSLSKENTNVTGKSVIIDNKNLIKSCEENVKSETKAEADADDSSSTALETRSTKARAYSYFYVGSWIWHIPLWFTLWFSFYVAFNVVRAINGHSVRIIFCFSKLIIHLKNFTQ